MKGRKLVWRFTLLLCLSAAAQVFAQGGGKAEPLRIEFKRGAESTIVRGKIRGDEQAEYVFAARRGQQVKITLTSAPVKSAFFNLSSADGEDYKFKYDGTSWSGIAPATGDYLIFVKKASEQPGRASYSLALKIN
jgi:hypothetical protein